MTLPGQSDSAVPPAYYLWNPVSERIIAGPFADHATAVGEAERRNAAVPSWMERLEVRGQPGVVGISRFS